jgi:hypothetical protein
MRMPHLHEHSGSFDYDDAIAWLASHPVNFSAKFRRQAKRIGNAGIPAMVQVLAAGPSKEIIGAMVVLSAIGVTVVGSGSSPADFAYQVTMPDGTQTTVRPSNLSNADFDSHEAHGTDRQ